MRFLLFLAVLLAGVVLGGRLAVRALEKSGALPVGFGGASK